jgi:thymidylate kinase
VFGKRINKSLVDLSHKEILGNFKADFTFVLVLSLDKSLDRLQKRKKIIDMINYLKTFIQKLKSLL